MMCLLENCLDFPSWQCEFFWWP